MFKPNFKLSEKKSSKIIDKIPRLINICCRNEESVEAVLEFIKNNPNKITQDFLALMNDVMKVKPSLNSAGFPHRGSFKDFFISSFILIKKPQLNR
ncbi:MAG TPA: hypothetical protein VIY47_06840, partial [Ignavibacteriaceae bacterium]